MAWFKSYMPNMAPARVLRAGVAIILIASQLLAPAFVQARGLAGFGDGEMTVAAERELGDRIIRELYQDPDYLDDPVLAEYVDGIWQRLLKAARQRGDLTDELDHGFAWRVILGRDRDVNAFALPGGYLGVNTGLIAITASADELAMVLGHELSHITQRHIARKLDKEQRQLPLLLAGMIVGALAASKSSHGDAGTAIMAGSQAAMAQSQLAYSRDMEREADRLGFGVMTQAGFAPQGAASMFERLQMASRIDDNGSWPYLRSHPLNNERIADMQARFQFKADKAPPTVPLTLTHAIIAARARVLSRPGADTLRQYVDAANSPAELARAAPTAQAAALAAGALAASELSEHRGARALAARLAALTAADASAARLARLLQAEIELAAGAPKAAAALLDARAADRPTQLLAAQALVALHGGPDTALLAGNLRDRVARDPHDAGAWIALARLYEVLGQPLRAVRAEAEARAAVQDWGAALDRLKAGQAMARNAGGNAGKGDFFEASIIDARTREVQAKVKELAAEAPLR